MTLPLDTNRATVVVLSDLPLLALGVQACLAGLPGVSATAMDPGREGLEEALRGQAPDLVVVAVSRMSPQVQRVIDCQYGELARHCLRLTPAADEAEGAAAGAVSLAQLQPIALRDAVRCALSLALDAMAPIRRLRVSVDAGATAGRGDLHRVSRRELEVGKLVAEGLSSQEIGRRLFISQRTVEKHRANLMTKLGVTNAAGLARELVFLTWREQAVVASPPAAARLAS